MNSTTIADADKTNNTDVLLDNLEKELDEENADKDEPIGGNQDVGSPHNKAQEESTQVIKL